jgi:hypothetical protein
MNSVNALTAGLIDYAGLFPPAKLGMREALGNYAEYLNGPDSAALGKFIVPANRLDEFEECARELRTGRNGESPWRLSLIVGDEIRLALSDILNFEKGQPRELPDAVGRIDAVEMPISMMEHLPSGGIREMVSEVYVEVGASDDVERAIPRLKAAGVSAKLRTGGVTASAFPTTHRVVRFLRACVKSGVAFKATAGLHHPVRAQYPLTYEHDSERATMFGFLNVFLAAAFVWNGADDSIAAKILDEGDPSAFAFTDAAIGWRGLDLSTHRIAEARRAFAHSFGSCSFGEPVDELDLLVKGVAVR